MLRRIAFVGLPSPEADPMVQWAIAHGRIRSDDLSEVQHLERERQWKGRALQPGHTIRIVGPEHGYTKTYQWGPIDYEQLMEPEDAARLLTDRPDDTDNDRWDRRCFEDRDEILVVR